MTDDYKNRQEKYRTWITVSKRAIKHNVATFRKVTGPSVKMLGVVKSNAYGHELIGFSETLAGCGIDWLGVDSITEANALRRNGVKTPILVLGYTLPALFPLAAHHDIAITISTFESLKRLLKQKHLINVHLKVDTGMHRQGFLPEQVPQVLRLLKGSGHIFLQGVYTHFAAAKRSDSSHETEKQIEEFKKVLMVIKTDNPNVIAHAAATAGTLNYPEAHFDMVRVGIGLYGLWPSEGTKKYLSPRVKLQPALEWKTVVSEVKTLEKGAKIGYDYTESVKQKTKMAILPVGYWHGYFRALSSKGYVLVGGKKCKVLGRVAMDMIVVDVTGVNSVKVGDEAMLIGTSKKQSVAADVLAELAGTTSYEFVTRLNPLIKKYYL